MRTMPVPTTSAPTRVCVLQRLRGPGRRNQSAEPGRVFRCSRRTAAEPHTRRLRPRTRSGATPPQGRCGARCEPCGHTQIRAQIGRYHHPHRPVRCVRYADDHSRGLTRYARCVTVAPMASYTHTCQGCGCKFDSPRPGAIYHSNACRQRAHRARHRVESQATIGRGLDQLNRDLAAAGQPHRVRIGSFKVEGGTVAGARATYDAGIGVDGVRQALGLTTPTGSRRS